MTETKYIAGSGGGGKGGGTAGSSPTEEGDSLSSVQFAKVLDLISEGEIQGLDDGNKSIFLDDTPIEDAQGNNNFSGFTVVTRNGTQTQTHLGGDFGATETEVSVGVQVTNSTSVTRQITDTEVDRVRVTVTIPSLQKIEDDGDIVGNEVKFRFELQYNGGGFNIVLEDTVKGKSSSNYHFHCYR